MSCLLPALLAWGPSARAAEGRLDEATVARAVVEHVAAELGVARSDVKVPWLGLVEPLDCPADALIRVESRPGEDFRGHADLWVRAFDGGVSCALVRLRPEIEAWRPVPVATANVSAGQVVPLALARVRLTDLSGPTVALDSGPWQARTALSAGQPVTLNRVRLLPDQQKGEGVTIVAGRGGLEIRAKGRLMEDATLGHEVKVANLDTGTVVTGVLELPGTVRAGGSR